MNRNADVAVVGLGAMGALAAWRLSAYGVKVIGFERFHPGHDLGSSHGDTRIFRTAYFESPEYVPLLREAHELWRQLESESGAELLTETGGLMIGAPEGELVKGVLLSAAEGSLPHRVLTRAEAGHEYPQHRLAADEVAVLEQRAGFLRPERAVVAACTRAEAQGANLITATVVTALHADADKVTIETSRGDFSARRVLVTAGPWTNQLVPSMRLPLTIERKVQVWLSVDDPAAFAPSRFPIFIHELPDGRMRYGFPTTDGHSIKLAFHHEGAPAEPDNIDRAIHDEDTRPLQEYAQSWLVGAGAKVLRGAVCMYTNTPDERFLVASGPELPNVTVLSACSGHGFKFASVLGELMAAHMLEERPIPSIIRTAITASAY
jgi:sarcosine oxidase